MTKKRQRKTMFYKRLHRKLALSVMRSIIVYVKFWIASLKYRHYPFVNEVCIGYSIPGHSIWKRMPWPGIV
jgi:hypothetical protein